MSDDQCRSIELRKRAERKSNLQEEHLPDLSTDEGKRLVHELRTRQIELELQNEELHTAQMELTKSRDVYSDLYHFAPVGYLTVNDNGLIIRANMTIVDMLRKDRQSLIKRRFSGFIVDDGQDTFYEFRHRLRKSGKQQSCEVRMHRAGGNPFWARLHGSVIEMSQDKTPDLQLTITDITVHRLAEEALKITYDELEREIRDRKVTEEKTRQNQYELEHITRVDTMGNMATGLAHELNQPLGAIAIYADACLENLKTENSDDLKQAEILRKIREQSLRAGSIIQRLKKLAVPVTTRFEAFRIDAIFDEVLQKINLELKNKNISVILPTANLPLVRGDAVQISQVLLNLLRNAVDALSENNGKQRQIELQASLADDRTLEVTVQDSGSGLSDKDMNKVFDTFYTTKPRGMGMGLAISRRIIESHGGHIWATKNNVRGTSFHFTLPISGSKFVQNSTTQNLPVADSKKTIQLEPHIFIVEDDPAIRDSLKYLFDNDQIQAEFYASAIEFLKNFNRLQHGCLILDASMPEMSGIELLSKLDNEKIDLPVIMITGHADIELQEELKKGRVIKIHRKPFKTDELLASVHLACSRTE